MANVFNGQITISQQHKYSSTLDAGTDTAIHVVDENPITKFTDGESANQAEVMFRDTRTLAASASEELDLSGTALQDAFGNNIAFTSVKAMIVEAASGNTNDVLVGGTGSAAQWSTWASNVSDVVVVEPGGTFVIMSPSAAGYVVTATTADLLLITNSSSGTSVDYTITLIGIEA
jgi:hypothetical protein